MMSTQTPIVVVEIEALLPDAEVGALHTAIPPARAIEQLGRLQHGGARLFVLVPALEREDGSDLDRALARCDQVGRSLQEAGSRLEGALFPEAGESGGRAQALRDLCRRASCDASKLTVIAASLAGETAARGVAAGAVYALDIDGTFPEISLQ